MDQLIAYCGLTCSHCPAYIATQAHDEAALERVAAQWRVEYKHPFTPDMVRCDGCLERAGEKAAHCSHCSQCAIRACGIARGVANCAACADYACEKLASFLNMVPEAKATLEALRAG